MLITPRLVRDWAQNNMTSLLGLVPGANRAPIGLAPRRTADGHLAPICRSRCSSRPLQARRIFSTGRPSAALTSAAAAQPQNAAYAHHGLPQIQPRVRSDQAASVQHARGNSQVRSRSASVHGRSTSVVCSAAASWAIADGADVNRLALVADSVEVRNRPLGSLCCDRSNDGCRRVSPGVACSLAPAHRITRTARAVKSYGNGCWLHVTRCGFRLLAAALACLLLHLRDCEHCQGPRNVPRYPHF